jgi:citrate synthase
VRTLTTAEAAARLGVKPQTVYAYVSRGLLRSWRGPDGRSSVLDAAEVERLAARTAGTHRREGAGYTVRTRITLLDGRRLWYRGRDAAELAGSMPFEQVAGLLWTERPDPAPLAGPAATVEVARAAVTPLPPTARPVDFLKVIAAAAATADPLRVDLDPGAVVATASRLVGTLVDALPYVHTGRWPAVEPAGSVAARLWPRLTLRPATPAAVALLDAVLVLLADHELAASTLAARVAASTRADPYAVVGAAMGVLDGPLHGAASQEAYALLTDAMTAGAEAAVATRLAAGRSLAGFGHLVYRDGDPRAARLFALLEDAPAGTLDRMALATARQLIARAGQRLPTVDLALATFATGADMVRGAPLAIFAIARTAGWLAHALEEYAEPPHRFRPRAIYVGG